MTGGTDDPAGDGARDTRRARVETDHGDSETARRLARALRPDNTAAMDTRVEGSRVVTTIRRATIGSLQSTADDYVVNLQTGAQVVADDNPSGGLEQSGNHNTDTDRATNNTNTETDNE